MPVIRKRIVSPHLAPATVPLSQGVQVSNILYSSGQLGTTLEGELLEGMEAQTRQSLKNHSNLLAAAGATFDNVVKVTVLLSDITQFSIMNKVYGEFFSKVSVLPARAAFQVAALPKNALVEIELVAVLGEIYNVTAKL